ncbi:MAG: hypothetical protein MZV70_20800 [Desulfobacterales bacterium]|nr:hypothetical protein [Desulfobacterales bacterium]
MLSLRLGGGRATRSDPGGGGAAHRFASSPATIRFMTSPALPWIRIVADRRRSGAWARG